MKKAAARFRLSGCGPFRSAPWRKRCSLRFVAGAQPGPVYTSVRDEVWDVTITNGGSAFFVNVQSATTTVFNGTFDLQLTLNGEGKAN